MSSSHGTGSFALAFAKSRVLAESGVELLRALHCCRELRLRRVGAGRSGCDVIIGRALEQRVISVDASDQVLAYVTLQTQRWNKLPPPADGAARRTSRCVADGSDQAVADTPRSSRNGASGDAL